MYILLLFATVFAHFEVPLSDNIDKFDHVSEFHIQDLSTRHQSQRPVNQPHGDRVKVTFAAFGVVFKVDLKLNKKMRSEHITVVMDGEEVTVEDALDMHYEGTTHDGEWARATLYEDGTMHCVLKHGEDLVVVDPSHHHTRVPEEHRSRVSSSAMVSYRLSDVSIDFSGDTLVPSVPSPGLSETAARKLLVAFGDCPSVQMSIDVGVAIDTTFLNTLSAPTAKAASARVSSLFNSMNGVYNDQLNLNLKLTQIFITTGTQFWNSASIGSCPTIDKKLSSFSAWRGTVQSADTSGLWMLLTDCYSSGTVGLAWTGTACTMQAYTQPSVSPCTEDTTGQCVSGANVVSNLGAETWIVAAHELGHNLNGRHTANGIMSSVMDGTKYFDFSTGEEVCGFVASMMETPQNCFTDNSPVCGNGEVEAGEECDDDSVCCSSVDCLLAENAFCSESSEFVSEECCSNCRLEPTTTTCGSGNGFCSNGVCANSDCGKYGYTFCGMDPALPCKQRCIVAETCTHDEVDKYIPVAKLLAPELSSCAADMSKVCEAGACVDVSPAWRAGAWEECSVACGGGSQTRSVTCRDPFGTTYTTCTPKVPDIVSERICNEIECGVVFWNVSEFGPCSAPCAGGVQGRSVACWNSRDHVIADDSQCEGQRPNNQSLCNVQPCGTYNWVPGKWGTCDPCTDPDSQTRPLQCKDIKDAVVDDGLCTGARPVVSRSCNTADTCAGNAAADAAANAKEKAEEAYNWIDENSGGFGAILCVAFLILIACSIGVYRHHRASRIEEKRVKEETKKHNAHRKKRHNERKNGRMSSSDDDY